MWETNPVNRHKNISEKWDLTRALTRKTSFWLLFHYLCPSFLPPDSRIWEKWRAKLTLRNPEGQKPHSIVFANDSINYTSALEKFAFPGFGQGLWKNRSESAMKISTCWRFGTFPVFFSIVEDIRRHRLDNNQIQRFDSILKGKW